ncbi:protein transporter SEC24 [Gloeopeniophorella convolvens]|nr:protein transporter SEC24 [Gloeopeniophorella convolvens]
MCAHRTHIPQPPHSAGATLPGLRAHIEPHQIPSPVDGIEADRAKWENQTYMTLPGSHVPQSTSDFLAIDQGNSSPKFIRVSTWNMPSTSRLAEELDIPIVAAIQPFADLDEREEPVPLVECGGSGPARCEKCGAYVNAWCTWTAGGSRWKCNLCAHETRVESDYFSLLDANFNRLDYHERPELQKGTVDFVVSQSSDYWASNPSQLLNSSNSLTDLTSVAPARKPETMRYIFALDVSDTAVLSGFVTSACVALRTILYGRHSEDGTEVALPSLPSGCSIAFISFDDTIHFYDVSPNQIIPRQLVIPDVDDPFLPLPSSALFVDPHQSRAVIEGLLDNFQQRQASGLQLPSSQSCLGSALHASLAALVNTGGQVVSFVSTLPGLGLGKLTPLENARGDEALDDKKYYAPRNVEWNNLGETCADAGVGVTIFMAPTKFVDVGSIGAVPSLSGGDIFFHWDFKPLRDGPIMESQLRRLVTRKTAFNCTLRVRASNGLRPARLMGNFHLPNPTTPTLGTLDADKTLSVSFDHSATLSPHQYAYIQCAVLHTTIDGQRRVRVINLAIQVAELAGSVFRFADMDVVVTHMMRQSISHMLNHKLSSIRDELTELCSAILYSYRRNCAAATVQSQLIIPEAFRGLPVYTLSINKSKPMKAKYIDPDIRNYYRHMLLGASVRSTMYHLYPRMLAVHDLDDTIALPHPETGAIEMPSLMRASYVFMQEDGIYLIDNEELQVLWVGQAASPQLLLDLFGMEDIFKVDSRITELPVLETRLSKQVRNILAQRSEEKGGRATRLLIARQNFDATEIEFADMLVEDHNNAALSYPDCTYCTIRFSLRGLDSVLLIPAERHAFDALLDG